MKNLPLVEVRARNSCGRGLDKLGQLISELTLDSSGGGVQGTQLLEGPLTEWAARGIPGLHRDGASSHTSARMHVRNLDL